MTREEKENLLREAVDILIKLDNHLMTSRDNAEFSAWVEDLIENYCEEYKAESELPERLKRLRKRISDLYNTDVTYDNGDYNTMDTPTLDKVLEYFDSEVMK